MIERTGSNNVSASGPKNLRSANMKVHTFYKQKLLRLSQKKNSGNSHQQSEWQVSKNQPKHRVFFVFFSVSNNFPKWKSIQRPERENLGWDPEHLAGEEVDPKPPGGNGWDWKLDGNDPLTASFPFLGVWYIFSVVSEAMLVKLPGIGIIKLIVCMFFSVDDDFLIENWCACFRIVKKMAFHRFRSWESEKGNPLRWWFQLFDVFPIYPIFFFASAPPMLKAHQGKTSVVALFCREKKHP